MAEYRQRRHSPAGAVLTLIVGVMFVLTLSFTFYQADAKRNLFNHKYSVDIESSHDEYYEILCPVPVDSKGKLRYDFVEGVKVTSGEVSVDVDSSDHGLALRVAGHGPANISWDDSWYGAGDLMLANLSMTVAGDDSDSERSYVHCNQDGVVIVLKSFSGHVLLDGMPRSFSVTRTIVGEPTQAGWQLMDVKTTFFRGI